MKVLNILLLILAASLPAAGQKIIRETPSPTPLPSIPRAAPSPKAENTPAILPRAAALPDTATGATASSNFIYRNTEFGFQISLPADWKIAGDDVGEYLRTQGFDLSLKAPDDLTNVNKVAINRALRNVTVLLTALHSSEGSKDGAILRVSAEDLTSVPQVNDAVDYFDLMRSQFSKMKLPADFRYSETQAERLGKRQFAFIETASAAGKKRLYATVIGRHAIMFTLSYRTDRDLQAMRQILAASEFNIK
jgi:hypothetical protein